MLQSAPSGAKLGKALRGGFSLPGGGAAGRQRHLESSPPGGGAFGGAGRGFGAALRVLAHLILLPRLILGRLDADVFKPRPIFVSAIHAPKYGAHRPSEQ